MNKNLYNYQKYKYKCTNANFVTLYFLFGLMYLLHYVIENKMI